MGSKTAQNMMAMREFPALLARYSAIGSVIVGNTNLVVADGITVRSCGQGVAEVGRGAVLHRQFKQVLREKICAFFFSEMRCKRCQM